MSDLLRITAITVMFASLAAAIGLGLVVWRRRGLIRTLEVRQGNGLGMSSPVASDRVAALRSRDGISQGGVPMPASGGGGAVGAISLLAVIVVVGGLAGWWFLLRGGGGSSAGSITLPGKPATGALPPDASVQVPADPPAIQDRAAYTVAVLNASGTPGAGRDRVAPKVETAGYRVGAVGDAGRQDVTKSVVMWRPGKQAVAQNVAKDLGISLAPPLDGVAASRIGNADVVVIVGRDMAGGP